MCDPVTIGLALGGTAAQQISQSQKRKAARQASSRELGRQQGYDERQEKLFNELTEGVGRDEQERMVGEKQADLEGDYTKDVDAAMAEAEAGYDGPQSAERADNRRVVQQAMDTEARRAYEDTNETGRRRAAVDAWGTGLSDIGRLFADTGFKQRVIGGNAMRSAQIGQQEAQDAYEGAGNLMGTIGNVVSMATPAVGYRRGVDRALNRMNSIDAARLPEINVTGRY